MATNLPSPPPVDKRLSSIFINAPYGVGHQDLFLAYIVGAVGLGLTPRAAIEEYQTATSRLERIHDLIRSCRYSLHDLSFVALDAGVGLPRFNMPLELGLGIAEQYRTRDGEQHVWMAFDSQRYRPILSTSDLNGYDALTHDGTSDGVLRALAGNVAAVGIALTFPQMQQLLTAVKAALPGHYAATGQTDVFSPVMFKRVVATAVSLANS